jgi:uncharacterized repeat protein (TIGR03803 family)
MKKQFLFLFVFGACSIISTAQIPQLWGTMSIGETFGIGGIIKINGDGTGYTKVYSCMGSLTGGSPQSSLLPEGNSLLYGNTVSGGVNGLGDVFSYNTATNTYTTLHSMDSATGYYPRGSMMKANNNKLYGLTSNGGVNDIGVFFSLDPSNNQHAVLHEFDAATGQYPNGSVMQASLNNKLYGMSSTGGPAGGGIIFSYDIAGNIFTDVHDFDFPTGFATFGSLMEASNGLLYGMAFGGGSTGYGVIFSFDPANNNYTVVHTFNSTDGSAPYGTLIESSGILYGNTSQGGTDNKGIIFSFTISNGTFTKLHDFIAATGTSPYGDVMMASDGKLYGMTLNGGVNNLGAIFSYDLSTSTYTKIFDGSFTDGAFPYADLIEYSAPVGIVENNAADDFVSVYPVPSEGEVTVKLTGSDQENVKLVVTNALSEKLKELTLTLPVTSLVFNYPVGIYFITLTSNRQSVTKKIIIN